MGAHLFIINNFYFLKRRSQCNIFPVISGKVYWTTFYWSVKSQHLGALWLTKKKKKKNLVQKHTEFKPHVFFLKSVWFNVSECRFCFLLNKRSVQKVSSHAIRKIETKYKKHCNVSQWCLSPLQSRHLEPHTVVPVTISCPVIFSWISSRVWNLFPFKSDFSFGNRQVAGHQIWAMGGWVTWVICCFAKKAAWDVMHEWARCSGEAGNHQLLIAVAFWILQIVSVEECSSLMQNLMQIHCSAHCLFEWEGHTVHMFPQWHLPPLLISTVKLSLFMHVHSSQLYLAARLHRCHENHFHINNGWTFPG